MFLIGRSCIGGSKEGIWSSYGIFRREALQEGLEKGMIKGREEGLEKGHVIGTIATLQGIVGEPVVDSVELKSSILMS